MCSARLLPDWPLPLTRPTVPPTTVPTLRAVLLVSVELDEIMSLSDRILVIADGRIVPSGAAPSGAHASMPAGAPS